MYIQGFLCSGQRITKMSKIEITKKVTLQPPDVDLVCDYCLRDIESGEMYIETKYGEIYCDEDELIDDLEQYEYFRWKQKEE